MCIRDSDISECVDEIQKEKAQAEKEIGQFVNELSEVSLDSFIKAFEMGKNKIKEYPHCDSLIYSIATVLNAALTLSDVDDEKKLECNNAVSYTHLRGVCEKIQFGYRQG